MLGYVGRRCLLALPTLFGVALIVFALMRSVPGDVVTNLVGLQGNVSQERLAELRRMFGLDLPVHVQFGQWAGAAVRGDLGSSLRTGRPVALDLALRFPVTLELTVLSLVVALAIALPVGVLAALNRGRWADHLGSVFALLGLSIPGFFLGILLILLFSLRLGWLPPAGYVPLAEGPLANLRHMIMPALSLGLILAAATARIVRSTLLEVLGLDFVRTARAKGAGAASVAVKHVLRNACLPVLTLLGLRAGALVAGSVVVETVFAWPGVGRLLVTSVAARDFPVIQFAVVLISASVVAANLVVDLLYGVADPRVRAS